MLQQLGQFENFNTLVCNKGLGELGAIYVLLQRQDAGG